MIFDPGEALPIGGETHNADRQFQGWSEDVRIYCHGNYPAGPCGADGCPPR